MTRSLISSKTIVTFDILPMSSTAKQGGVKLAATAQLKDGTTKDWPQISRQKLLKVVKSLKADYLGTDNPSEILNDGEFLPSFCRLLPSNCSFVHVNLGANGVTIPMRKLVKQFNIFPHKRKMSPIITARAILQLIQLGVGMILEPFESETIIDIGRPKGHTKGGWSQARYERQGEEVVARAANAIKESLSKSNFQFDDIIRDTKYGAKFARFHIFSPRNDVSTILNKLNLYPAKIKIWSPKKKVVTHKSLTSDTTQHKEIMDRHLQRLIVGVDPGMTTGVAIANLNGKIISVFSKKNLSKGELVSHLTNYGIPVVVCSDVYPIPTFVSKLASTYNAELSHPSSLLSQDDKRELSRKSQVTQRLDAHERDAIAAVMYAYRKYQDLFDKIENQGLTNKECDLAKALIIRGLSVADSAASVKLLRKTEQPKAKQIQRTNDSKDLELIGRLHNLLEEMALSEETINNLRAHSGRLEALVALQEKKLNRLNNKIRNLVDKTTLDLLHSEMLESKDLQIKFLNKSLDNQIRLKNQFIDKAQSLEKILWLSLEHESIPIKVLPVFSKEAIYKLREERTLNDNDTLIILDPTGGGPQTAYNLAQTNFRMIFLMDNNLSPEAQEIFYEKGIPVVHAEKYDIRRINEFAIIHVSNMERAENDYRQWYQLRKSRQKAKKINLTIENYQYQRSEDIKKNSINYDDYEPEDEEINFEI